MCFLCNPFGRQIFLLLLSPFSPKKCTKEGDFSSEALFNSRAANLKATGGGATTTTVVACAANQRPYLTVMPRTSLPMQQCCCYTFLKSIGDSFKTKLENHSGVEFSNFVFPPNSNLAGNRIEIKNSRQSSNGTCASWTEDKKKPQKCRDIYILLYDIPAPITVFGPAVAIIFYVYSARKKKDKVPLYTFSISFLFFLYFIFSFTQVGIVNGGGAGSRVLGVTNGPETAASLLAAGLDARAAELVSPKIFWVKFFFLPGRGLELLVKENQTLHGQSRFVALVRRVPRNFPPSPSFTLNIF